MSEPRINPNGPLKGRNALVTGASRGIGEAIGVRLAMEGANVVVSARTAESGESRLPGTLHDTVDRIKAAGGNAAFIKADLAQAAERERLVEEAVATFGPIDILVNNAAITYFMPVTEFPEKRFKLMMEVQVYAPFHLSQLVLPSMKDRKQGWIVNISSGAGIHPKLPYTRRGGGTVYGMCKAALERFTTGLASEVYDDGIAVNVVSPGLVDTPGVAVHGLITEATKDRVQPIKYIAEAVYRLASGDPKTLTGTINYAEPFLKEQKVEPSELVGVQAGVKGLDALKAVGVAVLVLALNFGVVFLAVAAYAQFVDPGHPQSYYTAAAPRIAGWTAPIAGAVLLLIAAYGLGRRRPQRNAVRFAGLIWLAYVIVDLGSGAAAGDMAAMMQLQMAVSIGLALAGALIGGALARRRT